MPYCKGCSRVVPDNEVTEMPEVVLLGHVVRGIYIHEVAPRHFLATGMPVEGPLPVSQVAGNITKVEEPRIAPLAEPEEALTG